MLLSYTTQKPRLSEVIPLKYEAVQTAIPEQRSSLIN